MIQQHGKFGRISPIFISLFFVVAIGGMLAYIVGYPIVKSRQAAQMTDLKQPGKTGPTQVLTVDAIKKRALEQVPDASLKSVELQRQDTTTPVYQVKLDDGQVLAFDAKSGKLVDEQKPAQTTTGEASQPATQPELSPASSSNGAGTTAPGSTEPAPGSGTGDSSGDPAQGGQGNNNAQGSNPTDTPPKP